MLLLHQDAERLLAAPVLFFRYAQTDGEEKITSDKTRRNRSRVVGTEATAVALNFDMEEGRL